MSNKDYLKERYNQIVINIDNKKYKEALAIINEVPQNIINNSVAFLNALGVLLRSVRKPELSIGAYLRALKLEPNNSGTWSNLGNAYKDANMPEAAIAAGFMSIKYAEKENSTQWHNYGLALSIAGKHELAIKAFEKAIELGSGNSILWDLARSQLYLKKYKQGFENYKYRWEMKDAPPKRVHGIEWDGSKLDKEAKLFVYAEQGFGDYIQCSRYLPLLTKRAKNIEVEVKPELMRLMKSSFQEITFVDYQNNITFDDNVFVISILDLPKIFSKNLLIGSSGYLNLEKLDRAKREKIGQHNKNLKKIGIVWSGSLTFKRNMYRSISPEWFIKYFNLPGIELYSFQLGEAAEQANQISSENLNKELVNEINDFADTAVLVSEMDLIISTCTSIVHLCGSLGVPCWVLLDYSAHWLWGVDQVNSDWYDSVKIIRQKSPGDWRSVFSQATSSLLEWQNV